MPNTEYDVIIIGGGPAGIAAAFWCAELGLSSLLLESGSELGGQLNWVFNPIDNYLGAMANNGAELLTIFLDQSKNRGLAARLNAEVSTVDHKRSLVKLSSGESFSYGALIIATGVRRRALGVAGEKEFLGRGILFSGKRDQHLVSDKIVVVAGGGDAALENALILAEKAAKVIVLHRSKKFRARSEFVDRVASHSKIEIITDSRITGIYGDQDLEYIEVDDVITKNVRRLVAQALLVRIGVVPNSELFTQDLESDDENYIRINERCETSISNIFAIGDVANPLSPTISTAVGTGATAVKAIMAKKAVSC